MIPRRTLIAAAPLTLAACRKGRASNISARQSRRPGSGWFI